MAGHLGHRTGRLRLRPRSPKHDTEMDEAARANLLLKHPGMGRRLDRELDIPFGKRGYVMRYRLDGDDIVILKIWHSREERA